MPLEKIKTHDNNRAIWRLLTTGDGHLLIEERDMNDRSVHYSLINFKTGNYVLSNYIPDEKYWVGVETIHNGLIYFHGFVKPDMPMHRGITAFDVKSGKVVWKNDNLSYLFILNNKVYCYSMKFESKEFYVLDAFTGEVTANLGNNYTEVNQLKAEAEILSYQTDMNFPYTPGTSGNDEAESNAAHYLSLADPGGVSEYILTGNYFFCASNYPSAHGYNTEFYAISRKKGKVILRERINKDIRGIALDNFFTKSEYLFLLKEKKCVEIIKFTAD